MFLWDKFECSLIAGSSVTDMGLSHVIKFPSIEKLTIRKLCVTGKGLLGIRTLKYFDCSSSLIYDGAVCGVLRSCRGLEFLDVRSCRNVTPVSINFATKIVEKSNGRNVLKMHVDSEFENRTKAPRFFELLVNKCSLLVTSPFKKPFHYENFKDSMAWVAEQSVERMTNVQANVGWPCLTDKCMTRILRFMSIPERVKMEKGMVKIWYFSQ